MGEQKKAFRPSFFERIAISLFHLINRVVPWFKLPTFLGAINLALLRIELRGYNLHDGYASGSEQGSPGDTPMKDGRFQTARNSDGQFNSLEQPRMGCTGMRFGRNFPESTARNQLKRNCGPQTRELSVRSSWHAKRAGSSQRQHLICSRLLGFSSRRTIGSTTSSNMRENEPHDIPLPPGHSWQGKMTLPKTKPDEILDPSDVKCPGYKNINTAWWDGSQIYGSTEEATRALRTSRPDGKLELAENRTGGFHTKG
ncbi:unnamed protein product [Clonostachys rosea f. rosea IK726]|uniref:Uncharacterized protein n=1 Tax=Clonostachys rosea f. rosea IK726 TaxID=1349383 RepID=A0ACA9U669_BIOOC|nr:unnamed protein product [Clonostachys rosea f. rosea IK726]